MADEIPEWVWSRVEKLCGDETDSPNLMIARWYPSVRAFARYIMEHEEPPVDPLLAKTAAAFEALWNENEYGTVERWAGRLQTLLNAQGLKIVEAGDGDR